MLNRNSALASLTPDAVVQTWTTKQQKLLDLLVDEANRHLHVKELCHKAGVSADVWYCAVKNPDFVSTVEALGVRVKRVGTAHLDINLAPHPEEEFVKDVWDMRRLKAHYPKHRDPNDFKIDFSWIANPLLRQQVKDYFRLRLPRWKPYTFRTEILYMRHFLLNLPADIDIGLLTRYHVEHLLPKLSQLSDQALLMCLRKVRAMLTYMTSSPTWNGPRPPRFLIWDEDLPSKPHVLPRPIPQDVIDQLDLLLEEVLEQKQDSQVATLLPPMLWDAILILRRTGMRTEDLAHLKAPDIHGRNGCLEQDTEGYWWVCVHHSISKMNRDHRIPTKMSDGVMAAVHRQRERVQDIPDHFGEHYLFRTTKGVLTYGNVKAALQKLASRLTHEGQPYAISPHQFRHTIASDMIEQGIDIYTVKEFLGHVSLAMTERYVLIYLKSIKAKYDAYRAKKQSTYAASMIANQVQVAQLEGEADGGWVENKVGKNLYQHIWSYTM